MSVGDVAVCLEHIGRLLGDIVDCAVETGTSIKRAGRSFDDFDPVQIDQTHADRRAIFDIDAVDEGRDVGPPDTGRHLIIRAADDHRLIGA